MKEEILEEFKTRKKIFNAFKDRMINLLKDLIEGKGHAPHQIVGRTKDLTSLAKKIDKKGEKYNSLEDITDIVGIRVITYLESDVNPIADIIETEFIKDNENSIDKRILKNDQFGYRSLHVVVSLNDKRIKLPEYSSYKSIKCEIQIRSILQHAWAEIEHDLGYKGNNIPDDYKRSFNRVAALLEVADIEFDKLKRELDVYEKDVPSLIDSNPQGVDINKASLSSFLKKNHIIDLAKKIIIKETGSKLSSEDFYAYAINALEYFNIKTIKKMEDELNIHSDKYLKFTERFLINKKTKGVIPELATILYFCNYLIAKENSVEKLKDYFSAIGLNLTDEVALSYFQSYEAAMPN